MGRMISSTKKITIISAAGFLFGYCMSFYVYPWIISAKGHNRYGMMKYRNDHKSINVLYDVQRILYNRVPKCGSTTVRNTINYFKKKNNFTYYSWPKLDPQMYPQEKFIANFYDFSTPLLYDMHIYFVDFASHGKEFPVYINVVRDPLERLISHYYFIRFDMAKGFNLKLEKTYQHQTFDECVEQKQEECMRPVSQLMYFCGATCINMTDEERLAVAKKNVIKYYAVVGVTEDLGSFFEVLEFLIPNFFKGSKTFYDSLEDAEKSKNFETSHKTSVKRTNRNIMKKILNIEYEFYYFVKQRYYGMLKRLKAYQRL